MKVKIRRRIFPGHLADLKKSGISKRFAKLNGLYSVDRAGLSRLLGQFVDRQVKTALIFPYLHTKGFFRAKLFPSYLDERGKPVKYLQRKDSGAWFYIPPCVSLERLKDSSTPLTIIEGEKKLLAAIEKGIKVAIGIGGIWNGIKDHKPIAHFSIVSWKHRIITFVPDADVWSGKSNLREGVFAFCKFMEEETASVHIVSLPDLPNGKKTGLDDYLLTYSLKDFHSLPKIDLSNEIFLGLEGWFADWKLNKSKKLNNPTHNTLNPLISPSPTAKNKWPDPLPLDAYYGLAGDFVRLIEPATEGDPIALYIQFLILFGNMVGRAPHAIAEKDRHSMILFVVLVGETSKGRKGSSLSQVVNIFELLEPGWFDTHRSSGLSSGEGLVWSVRDPIEKTEPIKKKGMVVSYQTVIQDPGVKDKRVIFIETEFASVLKVMQREGNTISVQIRQAWEGGTIRVTTKNNPIKATNAHVSILGHITKDELRRRLHESEMVNGLANRFLWLCVRRSKLLPEGGSYDELKLVKLLGCLDKAVQFASKADLIQRSPRAKKYWRKIYRKLSKEKPGMAEAVIQRAEAQVLRLSCLFALLDLSKIVRRKHLKAALDLWSYAEQSVHYIFGKSIGDDIADRIYFELTNRPEGMTLSEISALFSNHKGKDKIHISLQSLLSLGFVRMEDVPTDGRPKRIIKAVLK